MATHLTVKLSWSFGGKDGTKVDYFRNMYSFTRIDFQKLMEVWSRKTITYSILKVIKTLLIDQIMPIQLNGKVVSCVFNGYIRSRKYYELLEVEPKRSKFINLKCMTFSECRQGKKSKYIGILLLNTMTRKTHVKVEVRKMEIVVVRE